MTRSVCKFGTCKAAFAGECWLYGCDHRQRETCIYGYFDHASQLKPTVDPGLRVPCPICLRTLANQAVTTISLMLPGDKRSYFFRAHRDCWREASAEQQEQIEGALIDSLTAAPQRTGDVG